MRFATLFLLAAMTACSASAVNTDDDAPRPDAATTDDASAGPSDAQDGGPAPDPGGCYAIGQDPNPGNACTPGCWYRQGSREAYHGPIVAGAACVRGCLVSGQLSSDCLAPPDAATGGECAVGQSQRCYSGPAGTEGVGQCHGATRYCVAGQDGQGHWSPGCVGEVTPYSLDEAYDGIDNDCDGLVDNDARLFASRPAYCDPGRGCYWLGSEPEYAFRATYGEQGCFTSGQFRPLVGPIVPGMIVSDGAQGHVHAAYYVGTDRHRHSIPNAMVFGSWYVDEGNPGLFNAARGCADIVQVSTADLAAIPLGQNITFRPGTVATGIVSDPRRYVVSHGGTLRPIGNMAFLAELQPAWVDPRVVMMPDYLMPGYAVGETIENPSTYDWRSEIAGTMDQAYRPIP